MNFNKGHFYVIAENYFDLAKTEVLFEIKDDQNSGKKNFDHLDLERFFAGGYGIYYCRLLDSNRDEEYDEEVYDLILRQNDEAYGFDIIDHLADFPLIEGKFTPGIYSDEDSGEFYEIRTVKDLEEFYKNILEDISPDQLKIICLQNVLELVEVTQGKDNLIEIKNAYPFTYFDVHCPICSKKIIGCKFISKSSCRIKYEENKCLHYIGKIYKIDNQYDFESLDALGANYKLKDRDLYLKIDKKWRKPIVYIAPCKPLYSYWGKSQEAGYSDVFIFLSR